MSTARFVNAEQESKRFGWKDFLKRHPLFFGLKEAEIVRLVAAAQEREIDPGEVVLKEGEEGDSIFLIGSGSVQILLTTADGEEMPLVTLKTREYFGEMAVLERRPRAATGKALTRTILLEIRRSEFARLMADHPEIEFRVLLKLSERLRQANDQILSARTTVDAKLTLLDSKLTTEQKIVEATLKAAHGLFEQTNARVSEVIHSAERGRARLIAAMTAAGTVITLFGWLGFKELLDVKSFNGEVEKARVEMSEIDRWSKTLAAGSNDLNALQQVTEESKRLLAEDFLIPRLRDAIEGGRGFDAEHIYGELREFKLKGLDCAEFLDQVGLKIQSGSVQHESLDYTGFLTKVLQDVAAGDALRVRVLMLANMIVLAPPTPGAKFVNDKTFDEAFSEFSAFVAKNRGYSTFSMEKADLTPLQDYFKRTSSDKEKQGFRRVTDLVPVVEARRRSQ